MKKESKSTIEDVNLASTQELVVEYVMTKAWKDSLNAEQRAAVDALPDGSHTQGRHGEVVDELARRFPLDSYTGEKLYEDLPALNPEQPTEKEKLELKIKEAEEALKAEEEREKAEEKNRKESEEYLKEEAKAKEAAAAKAAHHDKK